MVRPLFSPPYVVNFELYFYSDSPIKMGSVRPVMIQNQDSATLPAQFPSPAPIKGLKSRPYPPLLCKRPGKKQPEHRNIKHRLWK